MQLDVLNEHPNTPAMVRASINNSAALIQERYKGRHRSCGFASPRRWRRENAEYFEGIPELSV